jgi:hypothetical protein
VHIVVLRAEGYQVLLRQCHLCYGRRGEYTWVIEYGTDTIVIVLYPEQTDKRRQKDTRPTFHCFQTMTLSREPGGAEARVPLSPDAEQ